MKKYVIPFRFLKLEDQGFHLLVKMKVDGKPANMLVDTGASQTVFDKHRITSLIKGASLNAHEKLSTGLGTNSMQSLWVIIPKIELGSLKILDYKSVVLDLSHVNISYERMKLKAIDGVLGSDILKHYGAVIDYGKKTITFLVNGSGTKPLKKRK